MTSISNQFRQPRLLGKVLLRVCTYMTIGFVLFANCCVYGKDQDCIPSPEASLSLNQAIEIALSQHPDILSSKFRVDAGQEEVTSVESKYFPQIYGDAAGAYAKTNTRAAAIGTITNPLIVKRISYGVTVNQMLTDFGRTDNLTSAAKSGVDAKIAKSLSVRDLVIFKVTQAYYNQLRAQEIVKVAEETLKVRNTLFEKIQLFYKEKLKSGFDVSIVNQSVAEAKLLILKAQNDLDDARAELSQTLGYGELKNFRLVEGIEIEPYTMELDPLLKRAKESNPELVSLRNAVLEKKFQYEAAVADHNPTVNAIGYAGINPVREKSEMNSNYATAGIAIDVPIFTGGRITAQERQAFFEMKAVEKELTSKENQIMKDVRQAWNNVQSSYQNITVLKDLVLNNIKALELAQAGYDFGRVSIVDLVQEQLNETQAELSLSTARYEYLINLALLNLLLGNCLI